MQNAVLNRISTRTFSKENLSNQHIDFINKVLQDTKDIKTPFDQHAKFTKIFSKDYGKIGKKIGTYGIIKNPTLFIGGTCKNEFQSIVDFGYLFEWIILKLTEEQLGTCWLGGTFKRKQFIKDVSEGDVIPAISPVGYAAKDRSFVDKGIRNLAKSSDRLDIGDIVKRYDGTALSFSENTIILQALSLVRRGPSASNKQPWRIYIDNNDAHFYLKRTPKYPSVSLGYDIQALDIGIALCHYIVGLESFGVPYNYDMIENPVNIPDEEYVISVRISK
jgi:hypothetical protein